MLLNCSSASDDCWQASQLLSFSWNKAPNNLLVNEPSLSTQGIGGS
jgi:hypothetical protein